MFSASAAADVCERVTSCDLNTWRERFRQRRQRGYTSGDFHGGRIVIIGSSKANAPNKPEVDGFIRRYGLDDEDDLICATMKTEDIARRRRDYIVPSQNGRPALTDIVMVVNPEKYPL